MPQQDDVMSQQWVDIARRAATLDERLAAYRRNGNSGALPAAGAADHWLRVAADGDIGLFLARLDSLGIALTDLPDCLAEPDTSVIPDYLDCLVEVADGSSRLSTLAELVAPLVGWAESRIAKSDTAWETTVIAGGSAHLTRNLTGLIAPCWEWLGPEGRDGGGVPTEVMWAEFPALARQVGIAVRCWVDRTNQFLDWLATDCADIRRVFGIEVDRLASVEFGLSDPHAGQATVARLEFSDGAELIFKPKSVGAENALTSVWRLLNRECADVCLPTYEVLDCQDHGWVQAIAHDAGGDQEFLTRYYHQCGALTAAVYALGGTDCTTENVIANSAGPVLIDAETVLHPVLAPDGVVDAGSSNTVARDLVVDTMMLPRWMLVAGSPVDVSALGAASCGDIAIAGLTINSSTHTSTGSVSRVGDYLASYLAGFQAAWTAAADVPVDAVAEIFGRRGVRLRALVRTTDLYLRLLRNSRSPTALRDGLTHSLHFERLARMAATKSDRTEAFALADAERRQLELGDVPIFQLAPTDRDVRSDEGVVVARCVQAPIEHAVAAWTQLTEDNLDRQRQLATAAISVADVDRAAARWRGLAVRDEAPAPDRAEPPNRDEIVEAVDQLARQVTLQVRRGYAEGLVAVGQTRWSVGRNDPFLDDGRAGIGLALLAVARVRSDSHGIASVARELLLTSLSELESRAPRWRQMRGAVFASLVSRTARAWTTAAGITSDAVLGERLIGGASMLAAVVPGPSPAGGLRPQFGGGDTYWSGLAGRLERARSNGSIDNDYWQGVRSLSTRALHGTLNVAVPSECPLLPLGFHQGASGIMFALAAALSMVDSGFSDSPIPGVIFW